MSKLPTESYHETPETSYSSYSWKKSAVVPLPQAISHNNVMVNNRHISAVNRRYCGGGTTIPTMKISCVVPSRVSRYYNHNDADSNIIEYHVEENIKYRNTNPPPRQTLFTHNYHEIPNSREKDNDNDNLKRLCLWPFNRSKYK